MTLSRSIQEQFLFMYLSFMYWATNTIYGVVIAIIKYTPNRLLIFPMGHMLFSNSRSMISLVGAHDGLYNISNKFEMFLNWYWDDDYNNEFGGVNLLILRRLFPVRYIYLAYFIGNTFRTAVIDTDEMTIKFNNSPLININFYQVPLC